MVAKQWAPFRSMEDLNVLFFKGFFDCHGNCDKKLRNS
jgi:hypothetical protein